VRNPQCQLADAIEGLLGVAVTDIAPNGRGVTSSKATIAALMEKWGDRTGLTATIRRAP
jgi:hypothetical protein